MAHVTAAKVTATQKSNRTGKRRGIKTPGGMPVKIGAILVRQLGKRVIPGTGVGIGKDYTIYAKMDGIVKFTQGTGFKRGRKVVNVVAAEAKAPEKKPATKVKKETKK